MSNEEIAAAIQRRAREGTLSCGNAFRIAEELGEKPRSVGETADERGVRLVQCQLGLFGQSEGKRIVKPAEEVSPTLEQAIREGLILGRLPCAVAWAVANRVGMSKRRVANAAEKLGIRIGQCQLGAF